MKNVMTGLLKGRITRWGLLATVLATAGLSVAWLGPVHYRLGGGFIGSPARSGGMWWSAFQAPLDSAGKTAALRVNVYAFTEAGAGLLALCGADAVSDGIGQLAMISNDTAKGSMVFYAVKHGNPSLGIPEKVTGIWVFEGLIKFTSPDTYDVEGGMFIYSAAADGDGDGRPDPGAEPLLPGPVPAVYQATRVLP